MPNSSSPQSDFHGVIRTDRLIGILQEFLAVEEGNAKIYALALKRSDDADVRARIREFHDQTLRHMHLLERAIRTLGGNPDGTSWGAEVQIERIESMMDLEAPVELYPAIDIENLVFSETRCHLDWHFLGQAAPYIDDEETREMIEEMVDEALSDEEEHVNWATITLSRMMLESLLDRTDQSLAA